MKIKLVINDKVYDELNIIVRGDVNGDGMITVSDTALFNKMILGSKEATYLLLKASDINLDGFITVADMTKTNNYILLKITTLNDVNN